MLDVEMFKRKISEKVETPLEYLIEDIQEGRISLPEFQRDYVWNLEQVKNLLISIVSGRIVGGILIWETDLDIDAKMIIESKERQSYRGKYQYLLDGQQRITSIFYAINGGKYGKNDFSKIHINVKADKIEDFIVLKGKTQDNENKTIPFADIFDKDFHEVYQDELTSLELSTLKTLAGKIEEFSITVFKLKTNDIEEAVSQFNALNSGGKNMSVLDIVLSKIYSQEFKLKEESELLISSVEGFGLNTKTLLDTLMFTLKRDYSSRVLLSLKKDDVSSNWHNFRKALRSAVDYMMQIGFYHIDLLPYKYHFIALVKVFYDKNISQLNGVQHKNFIDFVLSTGLTKKFRVNANPMFKSEYIQLEKEIDLENNKKNHKVHIDTKYIISNGENFSSKGTPFTKAVLWMLWAEKPLSFKNNNMIAYSKKSTSGKYDLNLHHIFPTSAFKDSNFAYPINHIVNICPIESGINQHEISDKRPSVYFEELKLNNPQIQLACESHLIPLNVVLTDNYEKFFEIRLNAILAMIYEYFPESK